MNKLILIRGSIIEENARMNIYLFEFKNLVSSIINEYKLNCHKNNIYYNDNDVYLDSINKVRILKLEQIIDDLKRKILNYMLISKNNIKGVSQNDFFINSVSDINDSIGKNNISKNQMVNVDIDKQKLINTYNEILKLVNSIPLNSKVPNDKIEYIAKKCKAMYSEVLSDNTRISIKNMIDSVIEDMNTLVEIIDNCEISIITFINKTKLFLFGYDPSSDPTSIDTLVLYISPILKYVYYRQKHFIESLEYIENYLNSEFVENNKDYLEFLSKNEILKEFNEENDIFGFSEIYNEVFS